MQDSREKIFQQDIELVKERRTALISAAVTGKIDVSTELNAGVRGEAGVEGDTGVARTEVLDGL